MNWVSDEELADEPPGNPYCNLPGGSSYDEPDDSVYGIGFDVDYWNPRTHYVERPPMTDWEGKARENLHRLEHLGVKAREFRNREHKCSKLFCEEGGKYVYDH